MTEPTLNISRVINAPAERIFDAWPNLEMLAKFMIPGAGISVPKATTDSAEGGHFDIIMAVATLGRRQHRYAGF